MTLLEASLSERTSPISLYHTQSEEDLNRAAIRESHQKLEVLLRQYPDAVRASYRYFKGESHMSIPPLSFYYGVKHLLTP